MFETSVRSGPIPLDGSSKGPGQAAITARAKTKGMDSSARAFRYSNGRTALPGEYGCYQSHLKALSTFIETDYPVAIILEDDVDLKPHRVERVHALFEACPKAEVIKLLNHRVVWFKTYAVSKLGDCVGRAEHGPMGSAACYAISRSGAAKLIEHLTSMAYPWDVALERGWATHAEVYATQTNLADLKHDGSTIASRSAHRAVKFPWWRRLRTYVRRIKDDVHRLRYTFMG